MYSAAAARAAGIASAVSGGNGGSPARTAPHSASYGGGGPTGRSVGHAWSSASGSSKTKGFSTGFGSGTVQVKVCRPGPDLDRRAAVGQRHLRRRVRRHGRLEGERRPVEGPRHRRRAVGRLVRRLGRRDARTGARGDPQRPVARLGGGETRDRAVQPVGHRAERVVVERGHLARVDRAVREHRVPALPDRRRAHRHRVEPRRVLPLEQQLVGRRRPRRRSSARRSRTACRGSRWRCGSRPSRPARPAARRRAPAARAGAGRTRAPARTRSAPGRRPGRSG